MCQACNVSDFDFFCISHAGDSVSLTSNSALVFGVSRDNSSCSLPHITDANKDGYDDSSFEAGVQAGKNAYGKQDANGDGYDDPSYNAGYNAGLSAGGGSSSGNACTINHAWIALIFSYASNFDYTYKENADFSADFKQSVDINSGMFKSSFSKTFNVFDTLVGFVQKSINKIVNLLDFSYQYTSEEWEFYFTELYDRSESNVKELPWLKRTLAKENLNDMYATLRDYVKFNATVEVEYWFSFQTDNWWKVWYKVYGWTDTDIYKIHTYLNSLNVPHMYFGEKYCFGDET